ncbi:hypothetical protein [Nevskia ramosa]|uniref:hypothetical protein n=1 Tax=Nevskia ramosa TaxID=64002 RepID=UPI003D105036
MQTATILKAIGCPHLKLHHGNGYWYFVYDDGKRWHDQSLAVMRLNHLSLDAWVAAGKSAVAAAEAMPEPAQ